MSHCHLDSLRLYRLALSCRNDDELTEFQLPETLLLFRRKEPRCRSLSVQRWSWKEKFRVRREQHHSFKELTEISLRRVMKTIEDFEKKEDKIHVQSSPLNPADGDIPEIEDKKRRSEEKSMKKNNTTKKKPTSSKKKKKKKLPKTTKMKKPEPMKDEINGLESIRLAASNVMKNLKIVDNIKRLGKLKSDSSKEKKTRTKTRTKTKTKTKAVSSSPAPSDTKTKAVTPVKKYLSRTFSSATSAKKLYGTPARTVRALRMVRTSGDATTRRSPRRFVEMGRKNRAVLLLRRQNQELLKYINDGDEDKKRVGVVL